MAKSKKRGDNTQQRGPYAFRGGAVELLYSQAPEVVLAGCAGGGKSVASLMKLHICCEKVPGIRCLIVRKTRESLTESALVTYENKIVPEGHAAVAKGGQRRMRQTYRYPNKSEIIVGGMDKPSKVMSTEYDLIYVQEAIELREEDWEALITRLRNNKLSYQQIFGDTNPDAPSHWLKKRCDSGRTVMIESRLEDNPAYFDEAAKQFTPMGKSYVSKLEALTGPRLLRLRHGLWTQAEGVVYPEYDPVKHVIQPHELPNGGPYPPPDWPRYWAVDFGYVHPFVWHCYALDHDRRMYLYKEIYHTGRLVEDHASRIQHLWREESEYWARVRRVPLDMAMKQLAPRAIICDHDAEDRATLERHLGMATVGARKYVKKGIQAVSERLRGAGDGKPRLFFLADCLDQRDQDLMDRKMPCSVLEEFGSYVWQTNKDAPVKAYDDGADCCRYMCLQLDTGMSGLWETAEFITPGVSSPAAGEFGHLPGPGGRAANSAVYPEPRLRWGEGQDRPRRGGRLYGGGA